MGNFYTNVTVLGPGREEVAEFLSQRRWTTYVSPTHDRQTVVYDALADEQDTWRLARVGRDLSLGRALRAWSPDGGLRLVVR